MDAAALDLQAPLGEELDGIGEEGVLVWEDAGGEGVRGVALLDGDGALENDGTAVGLDPDEVDGAAGDLAAVVEDRLVDVVSPHVRAAEGGE